MTCSTSHTEFCIMASFFICGKCSYTGTVQCTTTVVWERTMVLETDLLKNGLLKKIHNQVSQFPCYLTRFSVCPPPILQQKIWRYKYSYWLLCRETELKAPNWTESSQNPLTSGCWNWNYRTSGYLDSFLQHSISQLSLTISSEWVLNKATYTDQA